jgi:hypothetical protein
MEQTFLHYVLTDMRFWLSSLIAILRSLFIPVLLVTVSFGLTLGSDAAIVVLFAAAVWSLFDWFLLIVRMARRIALGIEDTEALLMRSVIGNAQHLYRRYYLDPMPDLRAA